MPYSSLSDLLGLTKKDDDQDENEDSSNPLQQVMEQSDSDDDDKQKDLQDQQNAITFNKQSISVPSNPSLMRQLAQKYLGDEADPNDVKGIKPVASPVDMAVGGLGSAAADAAMAGGSVAPSAANLSGMNTNMRPLANMIARANSPAAPLAAQATNPLAKLAMQEGVGTAAEMAPSPKGSIQPPYRDPAALDSDFRYHPIANSMNPSQNYLDYLAKMNVLNKLRQGQ